MTTINLGKIKPLYKGAYAGGVTYRPLDFTLYLGHLYVCKAPSTGNLPTDSAYFDPVGSSNASVPNTPAGSITATTVQDAINKLDAEKVAASVNLPQDTDLNTVVKSGFYRLSTVVNGPSGAIHYGQMIVSRGLDTISQIAFSFGSGVVYTRSGSPADVGGIGGWTPWKVMLDSDNYGAYSPTLGGGGASGTWPISVTGSASTLATARTINGVSFNGSANISIEAAAVPNTPAGSIAATTVQAAINELDAEKVAKTAVIAIANGGTGATSAAAAADAVGAFRRGTLLGTVSQSAGVPTGAVIERGSNVNGAYVRFADGTQICTAIQNIALVGPGAHHTLTWTFPATFSGAPPGCPPWIGIPSVSAHLSGFLYHQGITLTTASQVFVNGATSQSINSIHSLAVGRWF